MFINQSKFDSFM